VHAVGRALLRGLRGGAAAPSGRVWVAAAALLGAGLSVGVQQLLDLVVQHLGGQGAADK
jgi:hypothetical protein